MLFKEFAHKTGRIIQGTARKDVFIRALFGGGLPEKKKDWLNGISESTLRGYSNGNPITQIAKKIYADFSVKLFESFINIYGTEAKRKLAEEFSDERPKINSTNVGEILADLFYTIIKEAAQDKDDIQTEDKGSSYVYMNGQNNINNTGTINISF